MLFRGIVFPKHVGQGPSVTLALVLVDLKAREARYPPDYIQQDICIQTPSSHRILVHIYLYAGWAVGSAPVYSVEAGSFGGGNSGEGVQNSDGQTVLKPPRQVRKVTSEASLGSQLRAQFAASRTLLTPQNVPSSLRSRRLERCYKMNSS